MWTRIFYQWVKQLRDSDDLEILGSGGECALADTYSHAHSPPQPPSMTPSAISSKLSLSPPHLLPVPGSSRPLPFSHLASLSPLQVPHLNSSLLLQANPSLTPLHTQPPVAPPPTIFSIFIDIQCPLPSWLLVGVSFPSHSRFSSCTTVPL